MKRWFSLFVAVLSMFFLPGCWDYQAMNTRASMLGMAIDPLSAIGSENSSGSNSENNSSRQSDRSTDATTKSPRNNSEGISQNALERIRLTVQFPIFSGQTANTGGSNPVNEFKDLTGEGDTIPEILKFIQLKMDKNLNTAQLEAVILSTQLTKRQMDNAIGELIRDPKTNPLAYVVVTDEDAGKILDLKSADDAPANNLNQRFSTGLLQHGYFVRKQLWEFWRDRTQYGTTAILPVVKRGTGLTKDDEVSAIEAGGIEVYPEIGKPFRLSKDQTLCVNLLNGQIRNMNMEVPIKRGRVALLDVRARSRQRCMLQGSKLIIQDHIAIHATLGRQPNEQIEDMRLSNVHAIEELVARYEVEQLMATMHYLQERGSDIFGFGRIYLKHHPEQEMVVKNHWEQLFQKAVPDVQVKVTITSKGILI